MYRLAFLITNILLWAACADNDTNTNTVATTLPEPSCNFQMQTVQSLYGSKHNVVGGQRQCSDDGKVTREILLFAPNEPIDNHKKCNVFATTDTALTWQLQLLAPNRIDVFFFEKAPHDSTILLQRETVYDSIEVVYGVLNHSPL